MKKIISFILVITMIFSFTACGTSASYLGKNVSVSVKKSGTKKMSMSLKDTYEEAYTLSYFFSGGSGKSEKTTEAAVQIFDAKISKQEDHSIEYSFVGKTEGTGLMIITYMDSQGEPLGSVALGFRVDAKGRIYCQDVTISNGNDYITLERGEEDEPLVEITDTEGGTMKLKLSRKNGGWYFEEPYDVEVLDLSRAEIQQSGYDTFVVSAVGEGTATVYFICPDGRRQLVMTFKSESDPNRTGSYLLTLVDSFGADYEPKTEEEKEEIQEEAKEEIEEIIDVPGVIEEIDFYASDSEGDNDTLDMTFTYREVTIDYICSRVITLNTLRSSLMETTPVENIKMSGGGITCNYYFFESGFGAAVWEQNGVASRLTFISETGKTSADYKEILQDILDAQML